MNSASEPVAALEKLVARYEQSLMDFMVIQEELRTLSPRTDVTDLIRLNCQTAATIKRSLEFARARLERIRARAAAAGIAPAAA